MENAIPSLIIGAIILTAIALVGRQSVQGYEDMGMSLRALESRILERTGTELTVTSTDLDPTGTTLTVSLRNDGHTRIAAFDRLDVIINYYESPTTQVSAWLPFNGAGPAGNAWTLLGIAGDAFEPGILNPGETALLRLDVVPGIAASQTNSLVIGTELGNIVEAAFSS